MFRATIFSILVLTFFLSFYFVAYAVSYLDGALLRAEGDIKVYLINNNIKRWVSSLEVFNLNNFKWQDVQVVSKKEVTILEEGEPIVLETVSPSPLPNLSPAPIVSISSASPVPAKINTKFPAPDYIRADWIISHATVNYGHVGQKIVFKYSNKEKDKVKNFRLYQRKPGDEYFYQIAEFQEVPSTGCDDIDIEGEWMMTEAGQCGYWAIQRIVPPGGRGEAAYLSAADFSVGEYAYYVAGVDRDGLETPASSEARMVFLNPVSVLNPVDGQQISGVYPDFKWTIAGWPADSVADYFIMISDNEKAQSPLWTKQLKISSRETERQFFYDGLGLNPDSKYKVNIYGHYRKSEYEPDYISIPFNTPEFWIKKSGWTAAF